MPNSRDQRRRHAAPRSKESGRLANEQRLVDLGEAIDKHNGVKKSSRRSTTRPGTSRLPFRVNRRVVAIVAITCAVLAGGVIGGSYIYTRVIYDRIQKITVNADTPVIPGQPFNVLDIGSDSRAGLSGAVAAQTGASSGLTTGQRSDVIKIMHFIPSNGTVQVISIPRDLVVQLLPAAAAYFQNHLGKINATYFQGPDLLVQTIQKTFGIPINYVVQVGFAGVMNIAEALGGVYLNFPYPSRDAWSGLTITHPGCQLVSGFQALAVARSRHFEYFYQGAWHGDGLSDISRIQRQDQFIRGMVTQAKKQYNPVVLASALSKIPEGLVIDSRLSLGQLIGMAMKFHGVSGPKFQTYTLPFVRAGNVPYVGDSLVEQEPQAQELLVSIFGSQLTTPTLLPIGLDHQPFMPPTIAPPKATPGHPLKPGNPATVPTAAADVSEFFNPMAC
jgi:LCP family protein required for cell wall assembly